MIMNLLVL